MTLRDHGLTIVCVSRTFLNVRIYFESIEVYFSFRCAFVLFRCIPKGPEGVPTRFCSNHGFYLKFHF